MLYYFPPYPSHTTQKIFSWKRYLFAGLFFGVCLITLVEWDACFIKQGKCKYKLTIPWQSQTKCYGPPVNYYACSHSHKKHLFISVRLPLWGGGFNEIWLGTLRKSADQLHILLICSKNIVHFTCMPHTFYTYASIHNSILFKWNGMRLLG